MILVIYGSRTFDDFELLCQECDRCRNVTLVLCGCAEGADKMGREWAKLRGIPWKDMPAEWEVYGKKRAGRIRNTEMAEIAHAGMGFWDGHSTGTLHMNKQMKRLNKPFRVIKFTPNAFKAFEVKGADGTLEALL